MDPIANVSGEVSQSVSGTWLGYRAPKFSEALQWAVVSTNKSGNEVQCIVDGTAHFSQSLPKSKMRGLDMGHVSRKG